MLQFKNIILIIVIIGAVQAFQLSLVLFRKKENPLANKMLGFSMLLFGIDLLVITLFVTDSILKAPQLMVVNNTFPFLYGPNIFLYVYFLTRNKKSFSFKYLLHYLPFILTQIYGLFFFYFQSGEFYSNLLIPDAVIPWHFTLIGYLIPVSGTIYTFLTIKETIRYNNRIKDSFSNIEKINLKWIIYFTIGSAAIWVIVIIAFMTNAVYGEGLRANILIYIGIAVFLFLLGYRSLRFPEVVIINDEPEKVPQYKKSGVSDELAQDVINRLDKLMSEQKPHLNPELNLAELSSLLTISTHNLSEILNTKLNKSFYDYINFFRVEEVKKIIFSENSEKFSILGIGYEAGFSSKSAYYSAFKKLTGITPAQYRNDARKKNVA